MNDCGKIGAHGIQIISEVDAHVLWFWPLMSKVSASDVYTLKIQKRQQAHNS